MPQVNVEHVTPPERRHPTGTSGFWKSSRLGSPPTSPQTYKARKSPQHVRKQQAEVRAKAAISHIAPADLLVSAPPFEISAVRTGQQPWKPTQPRSATGGAHGNAPQYRAFKPEFVRYGALGSISTSWTEATATEVVQSSCRPTKVLARRQ